LIRNVNNLLPLKLASYANVAVLGHSAGCPGMPRTQLCDAKNYMMGDYSAGYNTVSAGLCDGYNVTRSQVRRRWASRTPTLM
jgi:hypothetical protein